MLAAPRPYAPTLQLGTLSASTLQRRGDLAALKPALQRRNTNLHGDRSGRGTPGSDPALTRRSGRAFALVAPDEGRRQVAPHEVDDAAAQAERAMRERRARLVGHLQ